MGGQSKRKIDHTNEDETPKKIAAQFSRSKRGLFKDYHHIYKEDRTEYPVLLSCLDKAKMDLMKTGSIMKSVTGLDHMKAIGYYLIKLFFKNKVDANNFILNQELLDKHNWLARIPYDNLESQGVIRAPVEITEEDLLKDLKSSVDIIGVKRFMKKGNDGNLFPLQTVLITFLSASRPDHVTLDHIWFDVREYIKPLLQCFVCYKFGHSRGSCKSKQICSMCTGSHFFKDCDNTQNPKCINCSGPHTAVASICPIKSSKIADIKNKVQGKVSYASVSAKVVVQPAATSGQQQTSPMFKSRSRSPRKQALFADIMNSDTILNALTKTVVDIMKKSKNNTQENPISSKLIKELLISNFDTQ